MSDNLGEKNLNAAPTQTPATPSVWHSGRDGRLWRHLAALILTALSLVYATSRAPDIRTSPKQLTSGFIKHYPAAGFMNGAAIGVNKRRLSCSANMWFSTPGSCAVIPEGTFAAVEWLEMPGVFQTYPLVLTIDPEAGQAFKQTQADLNRSAFYSTWPLLVPLGLVLYFLLRKPKSLRFSRYY